MLDVGFTQLDSWRATINHHANTAAVGFSPRRDPEKLSEAAAHLAEC
jgi:hypothetical protein